VDTSAWQYVGDFIDMIAYLLPMGHIKVAISFIITVGFFRIAMAVGRSILDMIPFL